VSLITGAIGIGGTYLSAVLKFRKDLQAKYDISLRDMRIDPYKDLWKRLEPLATYSPPGPLSYATINQLSAKLREWYFQVGGLFLSESSRKSYFELQKKIEKIVSGHDQIDDIIPDDMVDEIKFKAHDLRSSMAKDVGTRQESKFKYKL
jgi:hypothetical protein